VESGITSADWHFSLMSRLQIAVCDLEWADAIQFRSTIEHLVKALPEPLSPADGRVLGDTLHSFAVSAGARFHRHFHRTECQCGAPGLIEECDAVWSCGLGCGERPAAVLARWTEEFLRRFQASHRWAPEIRAATRLQNTFRRPLDIDAVAADVAACRALLTRRFKRTFGVSLGEYQRVLRAREAIRLLRQTCICVDAIARDVGYRSPKNLYAVLRSYTGHSPDEIRDAAPEVLAAFSERCRSVHIEPPRLVATLRFPPEERSPSGTREVA